MKIQPISVVIMGYQIHQNWQNMGRSVVVIAMSVYEIWVIWT
jgi:hypothetical protein